MRKTAVYEPPLSINGSFDVDWLPAFGREVAAGNPAEALVIAMKATQQSDPVVPGWLFKTMARLMFGDMRKFFAS